MAIVSFYPTRINSVIKKALAGDAGAQNELGELYREGNGVKHDMKEALRWYKHAADQGHPLGQNNLGSTLYNGLGVPYNGVEAVKWYRLAAAQGVPTAQFNLGVCYRDGDGVPRDLSEAARYFKLAAEGGHPDAENEYIVCGGSAAAGNLSKNPELFLIRGGQDDAEEELADDIALYEALTGKKATPEEIQECRDIINE